MKKNIIGTIIWLGVAICCYLVFSLFTPMVWYYQHEIIFAAVLSAICAVFVWLGTKNIKDIINSLFEHVETDEVEKNDNNGFGYLITIVCFIVMTVAMSIKFSGRVTTVLAKEGVIAKGIILDGSTTTTTTTTTRMLRRNTSRSNELKVRFATKEGEKYTRTIDVPEDVFHLAHKDMITEVIYLPQSPIIFDVVLGDAKLKAYKNITDRKLEFTDIEKLLLLDAAQFQSYLMTISPNWEIDTIDTGITFVNARYSEHLLRYTDGRIFLAKPELITPSTFVPYHIIRGVGDGKKQQDTSMNKSSKQPKEYRHKNMVIKHSIGKTAQDEQIPYLLFELIADSSKKR